MNKSPWTASDGDWEALNKEIDVLMASSTKMVPMVREGERVTLDQLVSFDV